MHPGSISGHVYNDVGGPITGVIITLFQDVNNDGNEDGPALGTATTNSSGNYIFTGVEPGNYVVVETTPLYYNDISDFDTSTGSFDLDGNDAGQGADNDIPVRILPGEADADNDFVDGRPGMICGSVKEDTGQPIFNVEIRLYIDVNNNDSLDVADTQVAVTFTDSNNGNYCFENITPGEYVISEIQPANYYNVSDYDISTGAFDSDGIASADDPDNEIAATVLPNEIDADNNFVEDPFTGSISGVVKDDLGAGIAGVVLSLYADTNSDGNEDGPVIATTSTNGSGAYIFTGIEPGYYVVVETSPFYYLDISDYDESISVSDTDGDDSVQGADNDIPVIVLPGEADNDNNFVEGRPGLICGSVNDTIGQPISSVEVRLYHDLNNNNEYDAGDALVATTFTDGDTGNYCFEDVTPGEYVVVEIQPANYSSISDYDHSTGSDPDGDDQADGPDDEIPVTLLAGENDDDNNFIEAAIPGSVSGFVVDDANAPLNNIKIYLYRDTNNDGNEDGMPLDSAFTNSSGFYSLTGVVPGYYVVVEVNPFYYSDISDYDATTAAPDTDGNDSASGPDNDIPVTITPGESDQDNNFKDGRPGTICGSVLNDLGAPMSNVQILLYEDENGNGQIDPADDVIASVLTDGDTGNYCFEDVTPAVYIIYEVQLPSYGDLSDWDMSPDPDGDDSSEGTDNNIPVDLTPNEQDEDNNFVDILCPGPPEILGLAFDTICSGGFITFEAMNQGAGVTYAWTFGSGSTPPSASGIGPHAVQYISNATNSTIGATVFLTVTKAGCVPMTEAVANIIVNPIPDPAINGATTNLCYFAPRTFQPVAAYEPGYSYAWNFGSGANIPTANTYGPHTIEYSTTGVKTVQLIVFSNAAGSSCGDTATITFNVIQCFGNITGKVHKEDGTGIAGVNVRLFNDTNLDGLSDRGAAIRSVFTTSASVYSMANLVPGPYVLVEAQPAGYYSLYDEDETNDNDTIVITNLPDDDIIPVTVEPQVIDADNVFVEVPSPGIVNGYVFEDFDMDVNPDTGEGIGDVTISLYTDADGVADAGGFVASTTTGGTGFYAIGNIIPGNYVLVETQPALYLSVNDIDPSNDNDLVPNTNTNNDTIPLTISNGETDANNYFIETIACTQMVTNTNDNGPGSLRYVIECSDDGDTIRFSGNLAGQSIHLNSGRIDIYKNLYIHSDLTPRIMIYSDVPVAFMIAAGETVEFRNLDVTSGLAGMSGAGFENFGNLILWDIWLYRNTLLPPNNIIIFNQGTGELRSKGICHIEID